MLALKDKAALSEITLFRDLPAEQLAQISELLRRTNFPSRTYIFNEDQPGHEVYFIHEGTIKILMAHTSGKDVILNIVGAGDVLGEMAVIDELRRSASALTLEACVLFWMAGDKFLHCLQTMPALSFNLTRIFSRRLRLASTRAQMLATLNAPGKVAHQLLTLASIYGVPTAEGGSHIPIRLTQDDLKDLVGLSRNSVNKALGDLEDHKLIALNTTNCRITVLNYKALAKRCGWSVHEMAKWDQRKS